ncbi:MAG: hypothetical protein RhofKO_26130 [Rhodothermales bacterium]
MAETHSVESELKGRFIDLWSTWVQRREGILDEIATFIAPEFTGFGTGRDERYIDRATVLRFISKEIEQVPVTFSLDFGWINVRVVTPTLGIVEGSSDVHIPIGEGETVSFEFRVTSVFEQIGGAWLLIHNHGSMPSSEQPEGETVPYDALKARNQLLERMVAERTRELQVEAALERVRASAMAMHNSEDLSSTIRIFYNEFVGLCQTAIIRCGSGVIRGATTVADLASWSLSLEGELVEVRGPIDMMGHPLLRGVYSHWEKQEEYTHVLEGSGIKEYYSSLKKQVDIPDYPPEARQYSYFHMFPEGSFYVFTEEPLLDEELSSFRRFSSVLSLTYRRYHDLQNAEAQAREAQIEAALERVRARAMAMRSSDELAETASVLFQQLEVLEAHPVNSRSYIVLTDIEKELAEVWMTQPDGKVRPGSHLIPTTGHPSVNYAYQAFLRQDPICVRDYSGASLDSYLEYIQTLPHAATDVGIRRLVASPPDHLVITEAMFPGGSVGLYAESHLTEASKEILIRFAKVFAQSYTRFEDLLRAEEQAQEARIEAALERVRSRSLAMTTSDELLDVAFTIRREFARLGFACGAFWHTQYTPEVYRKALTSIDGKKLAAVMELPRDFAGTPDLAVWEHGDEPVGVFPFSAEAGAQYIAHMIAEGKFSEVDPEAITVEMVREHGGITFVQARTSHGEIGYSLWGEVEPSEEAKDVLVRFASAFDLAYRRFEDLQRAEADHRAIFSCWKRKPLLSKRSRNSELHRRNSSSKRRWPRSERSPRASPTRSRTRSTSSTTSPRLTKNSPTNCAKTSPTTLMPSPLSTTC